MNPPIASATLASSMSQNPSPSVKPGGRRQTNQATIITAACTPSAMWNWFQVNPAIRGGTVRSPQVARPMWAAMAAPKTTGRIVTGE